MAALVEAEKRPIVIHRQGDVWRMWHPNNEYSHGDRSECRDLTVLVCFALERWPGLTIEITNPEGKKDDEPTQS